jgi:hypothetical protein
MTDKPRRNISGSPSAPKTRLTWSDTLNKRVRTGDWKEQAVSTTSKIVDAINDEDWEIAAQFIDYWMEEAKVVYVIYQVWGEGWTTFLSQRGISDADIQAEDARVRELLAFPDGEHFDPKRHWERLSSDAGSLANRIRGYEIGKTEALEELDRLRESWRQHHDRGADFQGAMLTYISRLFGEDALADAFQHVLEPYLDERYKPFDIRLHSYEETLERNLYLSFEAMRGHLVGPDRTGDMEVEEDEDKWVIAFDPCGSGGRMQRGDPDEGTPPRAEEPYNFGVTQEKHDWAWNEKGVCYYCAHCCFALEKWPANEWGHPLRVIDSPLYPSETSGDTPKKCTWTIYKSIEAIPESAYERIGMKKPAAEAE